MTVLYETYFVKLQYSKKDDIVVLKVKTSSVDYTKEDFVLDNLNAIESGIANFSKPVSKILIDSKELAYLPSIEELEELIKASINYIKNLPPFKIAFIPSKDKNIAISAQILIETFKQLDVNTKGFEDIETAFEWLNS